MAAKMFRGEPAEAGLRAWYDRFLAKAGVPVERREVPTAHGPSHVLLAGDGPPLVCLHGALASSAHLLPEVEALAGRFRLVLPDLPGQSVNGPPARLPLADDSLPRWLFEVLDGLGVGAFDLLGVSWGGFVARKAASLAPDRVRHLALVVPAGIVSGPVWKGLTHLGWPMLTYRLFPSERRLRRFLDSLLTAWDADWAAFLGDAFLGQVIDVRVPPLATDAQLRGLTMPTLVVGAEDDLSFPGRKLLDRVKGLVPGVEAELIPGRHCPPTTDVFRRWTADRVGRFIGGAVRV